MPQSPRSAPGSSSKRMFPPAWPAPASTSPDCVSRTTTPYPRKRSTAVVHVGHHHEISISRNARRLRLPPPNAVKPAPVLDCVAFAFDTAMI